MKLKEVKPPKQIEIPTDVDTFLKPDKTNIDPNRVHTLLKQMNNDDIIALFGAEHLEVYLKMKRAYEDKVEEVRKTNPEVKVGASKFRSLLLDLPQVSAEILKSKNAAALKAMFERYVKRLKERQIKQQTRLEEIKAKKQASRVTGISKRKFVGALLSKVTPDQYRQALADYGDAEKGKGLHKFSTVTPARRIKELEREAYAAAGNKQVEAVLKDPDAYKADSVSAGYKRMVKKFTSDTANMSREERERDPRYKEFVKPYTDHTDMMNAIITKARNEIDLNKRGEGDRMTASEKAIMEAVRKLTAAGSTAEEIAKMLSPEG